MALDYNDDITLDQARDELIADLSNFSRIYDYLGTVIEYHQDDMISTEELAGGLKFVLSLIT